LTDEPTCERCIEKDESATYRKIINNKDMENLQIDLKNQVILEKGLGK
jgi:hypothetical protein